MEFVNSNNMITLLTNNGKGRYFIVMMVIFNIQLNNTFTIFSALSKMTTRRIPRVLSSIGGGAHGPNSPAISSSALFHTSTCDQKDELDLTFNDHT